MNGKNKIGRRELEIIEYLQEKGETTYAQIVVEFSPTIRVVGGKTYIQYSICEKRIQRLREKGLIAVEKKNGFYRTIRLASPIL